MEPLPAESGDFRQVTVSGVPCREEAEPAEYPFLQRDQMAGQDLLPAHRFRFQAIGNAIIDILQKDDVRIECVEVR